MEQRTNIGIYLGYKHRLELDGEGIGRFIVRLVEGLLLKKGVTIYVAVIEQNYEMTMNLFSSAVSSCPERIFIVNYPDNNESWLNSHVSVDSWIVPYVGLEGAIQLEKPIILCVHDLVYVEFAKEFNRYAMNSFDHIDKVARIISSKAAAVISQSNYVRTNHVVNYLGIPIEKTHVIRLAPPEKEYKESGIIDRATFSNKYGLYRDYIVFPTIIRPHKNHCRLVEAFLRFKQTSTGHNSGLHLVLTDYNQGVVQVDILKILDNFSEELRSSVVFLGRIASTDIPSLYTHAKGTIVPTLFEGSCPFPIMESLLAGTPVATSRIEVTAEVIYEMDDLFAFNPYSIDEIQRALQDLWEKGGLMLSRQQQSIVSILQRSWTEVAHEYFEVIQQITNK